MKYKKVYVRLILTYLVVFMIPLMMEIYNLEMIGRSTRENICQSVLANLDQTKDTIDDNLQEIDVIVQNLTSNSTIRYIALLMDEKEKYIEISKLLSARDYMKTMKIQTIVDEYYLFFRSNSMIISSDHIFQDDESARYVFNYAGLKWEDWMEKMEESYTNYIFPEEMTRQNATMENRILYVQSMVTDAGTKGNFVFPIKSEELKDLMRDTYVSGPGWAYMMDRDGNILLSVPSGKGEFELVPQENLGKGEAIQEVKMGGRKMEIIQTSSTVTGLTYVAALPEEYITVQVSKAQKRAFRLILLVLVLGLGSILGVSWYRGRKIDDILQMLFKVEGGEDEWKGDEMVYISQSLKQLIENNSDLRENIKRQVPITRGLMLERLLQGGSMVKELEEYGIHLRDRKILVIAYQIEEGSAGEMKVDAGEAVVYKQIFLKRLNGILGGEQYGCDMDVNAGAVLCTMKREQDYTRERFVRPLEELCSEFWEKDGIRVRIAVGNMCEDVDKISKSYDQVYEMLQYGTADERFVFFYEDYLEKKDYYYFPVHLEERLVNAVRSGKMDSMHEQLKEVYQVNVMERSISPSMMHFLVNDLQCAIFKVLPSLSGNVEIDQDEVHAQLEQLLRENDILLRFNRLNHIFRYICEKVQEEADEDNRHQKEAIEEYIQRNYSNSDLSLTKIADDFNYASTYFSKLFKELFHENFVNYLERIRIEEVCRLLREGLKLEDIASRTGYNSVYVMRTAFKRIKGMTPNDFRKADHVGGVNGMSSMNDNRGIFRALPLELAVVLLLLPFVLGGCGRESIEGFLKEDSPEETEIIFIHNNPCEACDEEGKFLEVLKEAHPGEREEDACKVQTYYAYQEQGRELVEQAVAYFGLEKQDVLYPVVLIGDTCLLGYDQIRQNLGECLEKAEKEGFRKVISLVGEGQENSGLEERVTDAGENVIHLLYFYTEICSKCEKAEEFLEQLPERIAVGEKEYPLVITALSVAEEDNALYFGALAAQRNVPEREQQVPFLFLGKRYLSGENQIRRQANGLLEAGEGLGAVYRSDAVGSQQENPVPFLLKTVGVGFLNGFNPCAMSLVLLFFSLIASPPKGFRRYGSAFLMGKFTAYVALGLAAATAFSAIPFGSFLLLRRGINLILLVLCICLAIGNFLDCYHAFRGEYGKIRVQLPGRLRGWNDKLVKKMAGNSGKKVFLLVIFGGSMVIALGEFFCTGQIYLASILQWVQQAESGRAPVMALFFYSAALCCPALILLILIARGKSAISLANKSLKGMPLIKLCNGILFIIFAVLTAAYL